MNCLGRGGLGLVVSVIALGLSSPDIQSQETAEEAIGLVKTYIDTHNTHDLDAVMDLYAEDAVFHLSMQRPSVVGRAAIRNLERFDVAARSTLYPQNLSARLEGDRWHVDIGGVIEHSEIFEAAGATIVMAESVVDGFVFKGGKIIEIHQPEIGAACRSIILSAFRGAAVWLMDSADPRRETLVSDGSLILTPETIPAIIAVLREWRSSSANQPNPMEVSACAGFNP